MEYNLYFSKSDLLFHEFSFKYGPYLKLYEYTYTSLSVGWSFMFNPNKPDIVERNYGGPLPATSYEEDNFLFTVPIQWKINISVFKNIGMGFKFTYNIVIKEGVDDKNSVQLFISYRI